MSLLHDVAEQFASETAEHEMTVLHNAPVYRHLRFKRPGTGMGYFDIITWPGHLTICGDRDAYTFARLYDMFQFFRGSDINPGYWSEKVIHAGRQRSCKRYSEDLFKQLVTEHLDEAEEEHPGVTAAWRDHVGDWDECYYETPAREALDTFVFPADRVDPLYGRVPFFSDTWEWDLTDWDWHFLWSCYAIQWGIRWHDTGQRPAAPTAPYWAKDERPARTPVAPRVINVELPAATR